MLITLSAIMLASLRILGVKTIFFQAVAHVFMGYLVGTSVSGKIGYRFTTPGLFGGRLKRYVTLNFILLVLLSIVESVCFLIDRGIF